MKRFLKVILIGLLVIAISFAVACKDTKPSNPSKGNDSIDDIGNAYPEFPDFGSNN